MKKQIPIFALITLCLFCLVINVPAKATTTDTAESIISNLLERESKIVSLKMNCNIKTYRSNKLLLTLTMDIYSDYKSNKTMMKLIANKDSSFIYYDSKTVKVYYPEKKEVRILENPSLSEGQYENPKKVFMKQLETIGKTHIIKVIDQTHLLGKDTCHLSATPKNPKGGLPTHEFWVDSKEWQPIRTIIIIGKNKSITDYTYDWDAAFDPELLNPNFPQDTKVIKAKDLATLSLATAMNNTPIMNKSKTLGDVKKALKLAFPYLAKNTAIQLNYIAITTSGSDKNVRLSYCKSVTETSFDMLLSKSSSDSPLSGDMLLLDKTGKYVPMQSVKVRGNTGFYFEDKDGQVALRSAYHMVDSKSKGYKYLFWKEGGLFCHVLVIDDTLDIKSLSTILNSMKLYK